MRAARREIERRFVGVLPAMSRVPAIHVIEKVTYKVMEDGYLTTDYEMEQTTVSVVDEDITEAERLAVNCLWGLSRAIDVVASVVAKRRRKKEPKRQSPALRA